MISQGIQVVEPAQQNDFDNSGCNDPVVVDIVIHHIKDMETRSSSIDQTDSTGNESVTNGYLVSGQTGLIRNRTDNDLIDGDKGGETRKRESQEKEYSNQGIQSRKLADSRRQSHKSQKYPGKFFRKSSPGLVLHESQNTENRNTREHTETAVQKGCHKGIVHNIRLFRQIAGIGKHDSKSNTQTEKDLSVGGNPNRRIKNRFKVGFEQDLKALYRTGKGHSSDGYDKEHNNQDGHEYLIGPFQTFLYAAIAGQKVDKPGCQNGNQYQRVESFQSEGAAADF